MDPQGQVLVVAFAAPRVPAEPHWAQGGQRDQGGDVEDRQVVSAHIEYLKGRVLPKSVRVNFGEPRIVRHPQHHQARQGAERPVLDPGQSVEGEVQVGQLA